MTIDDFLYTKVNIDLSSLIIKHMYQVLLKDKKGYALPYKFLLSQVFEDYSIRVQVWTLQTTKDALGTMNHALPNSMK